MSKIFPAEPNISMMSSTYLTLLMTKPCRSFSSLKIVSLCRLSQVRKKSSVLFLFQFLCTRSTRRAQAGFTPLNIMDYSNIFPCKSCFCSSSNRILWESVSNAFAQSMKNNFRYFCICIAYSERILVIKKAFHLPLCISLVMWLIKLII